MMVLGLVAPANAAMSGSCRIEVEDSIVFPANEGERASYKAFIKTGRGEISGVCLLLHEGDTIKGAIVNEFGISALDFTYVMSADRMTLNHVIAMLDKVVCAGCHQRRSAAGASRSPTGQEPL